MVKDEYTLVLVKPDGVKTRHIGEIITRIERKGYKIEALKMIQPTEELLRRHRRFRNQRHQGHPQHGRGHQPR